MKRGLFVALIHSDGLFLKANGRERKPFGAFMFDFMTLETTARSFSPSKIWVRLQSPSMPTRFARQTGRRASAKACAKGADALCLQTIPFRRSPRA